MLGQALSQDSAKVLGTSLRGSILPDDLTAYGAGAVVRLGFTLRERRTYDSRVVAFGTHGLSPVGSGTVREGGGTFQYVPTFQEIKKNRYSESNFF